MNFDLRKFLTFKGGGTIGRFYVGLTCFLLLSKINRGEETPLAYYSIIVPILCCNIAILWQYEKLIRKFKTITIQGTLIGIVVSLYFSIWTVEAPSQIWGYFR